MSDKFSMDDYIDVAERIAIFTAKYPEGSLQTISWDVKDVAGHVFVVYRAAAYRTPDDQRPGHGTAWEPFPGPTPYTKNSELMNAETAAWGRAIVALGLSANRKIASKQEVRARREEQAKANGNGNDARVNAESIAELRAAAKGLKADQVNLAFAACGIEVPQPMVWNAVPQAKAAAMCKALAGIERA